MKLSIATILKGVISKGAIIMVKDDVVRSRMDKQTKDLFYKMCKDRAISPSELIRLLVKRWIADAQEKDII